MGIEAVTAVVQGGLSACLVGMRLSAVATRRERFCFEASGMDI